MIHLDGFDCSDPMHVALNAYLSDLPESEKLAQVQAACRNWEVFAVMQADAQYGEDSTCLFGA